MSSSKKHKSSVSKGPALNKSAAKAVQAAFQQGLKAHSFHGKVESAPAVSALQMKSSTRLKRLSDFHSVLTFENVSIGHLTHNTPIGSASQYIIDNDINCYYALPLIPSWTDILPLNLVNTVAGFGRYRWNRAKVGFAPASGTFSINNVGASTGTTLFGAVSMAIANTQDFPQPSDGGEGKVAALTVSTLGVYPASITFEPCFPASTPEWRRASSDFLTLPVTGYDLPANGILSGLMQTPISLAVAWEDTVASVVEGVKIGRFFLSAEIELFYPRGAVYVLSGATPFRSSFCPMCGGNFRSCAFCGGKEPKHLFPARSATTRSVALAKMKELKSPPSEGKSTPASSSSSSSSAPPEEMVTVSEPLSPPKLVRQLGYVKVDISKSAKK